jgi:hypothetical protein
MIKRRLNERNYNSKNQNRRKSINEARNLDFLYTIEEIVDSYYDEVLDVSADIKRNAVELQNVLYDASHLDLLTMAESVAYSFYGNDGSDTETTYEYDDRPIRTVVEILQMLNKEIVRYTNGIQHTIDNINRYVK